jgi:hypothetical protein
MDYNREEPLPKGFVMKTLKWLARSPIQRAITLQVTIMVLMYSVAKRMVIRQLNKLNNETTEK